MKRNIRFFSVGLLVSVLVAGLSIASNGQARSAVFAIVTCATTAACTGGTNTSTGPGVQGRSAGGHGVAGYTTFNGTNGSNGESAVFGQDLSASGTFDMGVQGVSTRGYGVRGKSTSLIGVRGDSASFDGVEGTSVSGVGVFGTSTNSVALEGLSTNYLGVYGSGTTYGLYGASSGYGAVGSGSIGVYGSGTSDGVYAVTGAGNSIYASASSGRGVYAQSNSNRAYEGHVSSGAAGLYITNANGNGGDISGTYVGLVARSNTFPLLATDAGGSDLFYVDGSGNVFYHGSLNHFASVGGTTVVTSFAQTTSPSIDETGTARLTFGQATVAFSPSFARSINANRGYQVFLTPGGDTRGLYVVMKYTGGFTVREVQGGRSNITFDYDVHAVAAAQPAPAAQSFAAPRAMPLQPAAVAPVAAPRPPVIQRPPA